MLLQNNMTLKLVIKMYQVSKKNFKYPPFFMVFSHLCPNFLDIWGRLRDYFDGVRTQESDEIIASSQEFILLCGLKFSV